MTMFFSLCHDPVRPNFDLAIQGYQIHVSTRLDERNTTVPELSRLLTYLESYLQSKLFFANKAILLF